MLDPMYRQELKKIEQNTGRIMSIESQPTQSNLVKCHSQSQSPLFSLPAELRDSIYSYALMPYVEAKQRPINAKHYHPLEPDPRSITSTSLLLTCRRVWLEGNHFPMQQMEHCFWFNRKNGRASPLDHTSVDEAIRLSHFVNTLTTNNRQNLKAIRVFAEMCWLESQLHTRLPLLLGGWGFCCPEILTITITNADWGWRGRATKGPLVTVDERKWLRNLLEYPALPRLKEMRLELETLESRAEELRRIQENIGLALECVKRSDHFGDECCLVLQASPPEMTWSRPTNRRLEGEDSDDDPETLNYRIVTVVWKVQPIVSETAALRRDCITKDDTADSSHIPKSKPPTLSIAAGTQSPRASQEAFNEDKDGEADRFIQRWKNEGSLLKFAPTDLR